MTEQQIKQKAEERAINLWGRDEAYVEERNNCKADYIAGATENGIHWHDLRKNPNDLPEKMRLGSREVYIEYKDGVTDFAYYRFDKKWWVRSENEELAENVIAWCKIPTFDKE